MQILFTNAQEIEKCGLKTDLGRCVYLNKNCIRTMLLTHFSDTRMTLKLMFGWYNNMPLSGKHNYYCPNVC